MRRCQRLGADAKDGPTLWEAATVPSKNTGRDLNELLAEGKVQRIGRGCGGNVYRYFAADLVRTERELASNHAVENAGRHLRGLR